MPLHTKKYLPWLLLVLLAAAAFGLKQKNSTLKRSESIRFEKVNTPVDLIEIEGQGRKVNLFLTNQVWMADMETQAQQTKINQLLDALENLQLQSASEITDKDSLAEAMLTLRLYSNGRKIYQLNFATLNHRNIIKARKGHTYFAQVAGKPDLLLTDLVSTNAADWYNQLLINFKPEAIQRIRLEYPLKAEAGFSIDLSDGMKLLSTTGTPLQEPLDSQNLQDYLHFFSGLQYSPLDTSLFLPDPSNEIFRLAIEDYQKKAVYLNGFNLIDQQTGQNSSKYFAAVVNNRLLVKLNFADYDPLLVERDYFLKK